MAHLRGRAGCTAGAAVAGTCACAAWVGQQKQRRSGSKMPRVGEAGVRCPPQPPTHRFSRMVDSSSSGMSSTCSSRKRERKALQGGAGARVARSGVGRRAAPALPAGRRFTPPESSGGGGRRSNPAGQQALAQPPAPHPTTHACTHNVMVLCTPAPAERLAAGVDARRVLCGKQHEVRVGAHHLLQLRHVQLAVVVKQPAGGWGESRKEVLKRNGRRLGSG